jgi:2-C-methyl-D-erythritol 4-phosphate cytidylyltransferase
LRFFSRRRAKEQEERPEAFVSAIIVAAGQSRRMGGDTSKQFILIDGVPVIVRTLKAFEIAERIREVVIAARQEDIPQMYALIQDYEITKVKQIITGGETRQESVFRAIAQVDENADFLAIHDGARPLIRPQEIDLAVSAAVEHGAAALGVPVKDTVKQVDADGKIVDTPERSTLWAVQTPQVFSRALYLRAAEQAGEAAAQLTDDCQLIERTGAPVYLVRGAYANLKITTPEDVFAAEGILRATEDFYG